MERAVAKIIDRKLVTVQVVKQGQNIVGFYCSVAYSSYLNFARYLGILPITLM